MHTTKLPVLYSRDRSLAFLAQPFEIAKLAAKQCVDIELNARDEPRAARLLVPLRVARAVLQPPRIVRSADGITRMKQDPGSGRWVQRADQAGRGAGTLPATTLHFKIGHREATA